MNVEHKSFGLVQFKASDNGQPGQITALVSTWDTVDHAGDRMIKGAFDRSIKERGLPPVVWSHDWQTPPIGAVLAARDTDTGWEVDMQLFTEDHPKAREVYAAMKGLAAVEGSRNLEFSFGYSVKSADYVEEDGQTIREIKDVDLFEVGPCLVGCNPDTALLSVKTLAQDAASAALAQAAGLTPNNQQANDLPSTGDNPAPNSTDHKNVDQEALARTTGLLLARPRHSINPDTER